mmetsp:Transcript_4241/g.11944  ORF Transcript_4241/g.11944 Transcript_4241/m.11944 type:complete len:224 (-) Transcript_4241:36-707(-)
MLGPPHIHTPTRSWAPAFSCEQVAPARLPRRRRLLVAVSVRAPAGRRERGGLGRRPLGLLRRVRARWRLRRAPLLEAQVAEVVLDLRLELLLVGVHGLLGARRRAGARARVRLPRQLRVNAPLGLAAELLGLPEGAEGPLEGPFVHLLGVVLEDLVESLILAERVRAPQPARLVLVARTRPLSIDLEDAIAVRVREVVPPLHGAAGRRPPLHGRRPGARPGAR